MCLGKAHVWAGVYDPFGFPYICAFVCVCVCVRVCECRYASHSSGLSQTGDVFLCSTVNAFILHVDAISLPHPAAFLLLNPNGLFKGAILEYEMEALKSVKGPLKR